MLCQRTGRQCMCGCGRTCPIAGITTTTPIEHRHDNSRNWPIQNCLKLSLTGPRAIGNRILRHGQHGSDSVGIADVEEHAFRHDAAHRPWFQVDYKQRLLPFNFLWIRALLLHPGDDSALMIAEIDAQRHQLVRARDIFHRGDRPHADVNLIQNVNGDYGLNRGRLHGLSLHSVEVYFRLRSRRSSSSSLFSGAQYSLSLRRSSRSSNSNASTTSASFPDKAARTERREVASDLASSG